MLTPAAPRISRKIIDAAAGRKVIFFPHGTYLVSDTLKIPTGTKSVPLPGCIPPDQNNHADNFQVLR